jgi:hypothetical protein
MFGQKMVVDVLYDSMGTSVGPGFALALMNYLFSFPIEYFGLALDAANKLSGFSRYL